MINVVDAISRIYPDISGGFVYWETQQDGTPWDNPEDGLIWENTDYSKPSWSDIIIQSDNVNLDKTRMQYVQDREKAYPSIEDQLDQIYHTSLTQWKASIKVIKDMYPKPE